ncbi:MAG: 50S ribosomal protein L29 [Nevskiaceae bacterium]|nr:MAG: 50S ribosomal protein L29 [Nevskiaceae bacterium]TBR72957.1 MAG: 50S ribosomal protein L29 [Nevskiaceae bacterium]
MKSATYLTGLRGKDTAALKAELGALCREQFSLRMQLSMGQLTKNHLVAETRLKIANVKTLMRQQAKA